MSRLECIGDDPGNDHKTPEDENTIGLEIGASRVLHSEDSDGSHDDSSGPVNDGDHHSRSLSFVSQDFSSLEEPSGSSALSHTEDEHQVHRNVAINHVKVSKSPRGAEEERSKPSEDAHDQGSELSGDKFTAFSVVGDSRDSFNQGESSVNSEHEQGQSK